MAGAERWRAQEAEPWRASRGGVLVTLRRLLCDRYRRSVRELTAVWGSVEPEWNSASARLDAIT